MRLGLDPVSVVGTTWRGPQNLRARAQRRRAAPGLAAEYARHGAITFLAASTVRPATYQQYTRAEAAFRSCLKARRTLRALPVAEMDRLLEDYMEHLYFEKATAG